MQPAFNDSVDARVDTSEDSPVILADWEKACIGWLHASCAKAMTCSIPPGEDCGKSDIQLRDVCRQKINTTNCARPDPASFDECGHLDESEACNMYCPPPQQFCFDFCFFSCLPVLPPRVDGGTNDVAVADAGGVDLIIADAGVDDDAGAVDAETGAGDAVTDVEVSQAQPD